MNILHTYIWQSLLKNRRLPSMLLMTAVAAGLVCTMLFFWALLWHDMTKTVEDGSGHWHYMIHDLPPEKITLLQKDPAIDKLYFVGKEKTYRIKGNDHAPFILLNDTNERSMKGLYGRQAILKSGRYPKNQQEIAISKRYLKDHPEVRLGDTLTLQAGERLDAQGKPLNVRAPQQIGEIFQISQERQVTIVGSIDNSIVSTKAYNYAISAADDTSLINSTPQMVLVTLRHPSQGFFLLPHFADLLGYDQAQVVRQSKNNPIQTNQLLLYTHFAFNKNLLHDWDTAKQVLVMPIFLLVMSLLCCAVFVFLVAGAFATWQNERRRHWGLLKSLGASPRQVRRAIARESALLAVPSAIFGALIGYLVIRLLCRSILAYQIATHLESRIEMYLPWPWLLFCLWMAGLVIYLAGMRIARPIAKERPLTLLQDKTEPPRRLQPLKKTGRYPALILSRNSLHQQKAMRRTARLSLLLAILSLLCLLLVMARAEVQNEAYFSEKSHDAQLSLKTLDGRGMPSQQSNAYRQLPGVTDAIQYRSITMESRLPAKAFNLPKESIDRAVADELIKRKGKDIEFPVRVRALPKDLYQAYARKAGLSPDAPAILHQPKSLSWNGITALPLAPAEDEGTGVITLPLAGTTDTLPDWYPPVQDQGNIMSALEEAQSLFIDDTHYDDILALLNPETRFDAQNVTLRLRVHPKQEAAVYHALQQDLKKRYPAKEDYDLYDLETDHQDAIQSTHYVNRLIFSGALLLAAFALIAANNTIRQGMFARRRTFLMLKALGMDQAGLLRTIAAEGARFALYPSIVAFLLAIPVSFLLSSHRALTPAATGAFGPPDLFSAMPWGMIAGFMLFLYAIIALSYLSGLRRIERMNVAETLREDAI